MGTFCTTTSLQTLMPGTSFDTGTTNLATKCIEWSENWIKGALSKRYDVSAAPFTVHTTTSMLTSIGEQLAMGFFWKNSSRGSKESITRGNDLIKDAKEQIMAIANYQDGLLDATTGSSLVSERSNNPQVLCNTDSYYTTFDEDNPLNWRPDPDKLDDIEDGRA